MLMSGKGVWKVLWRFVLVQLISKTAKNKCGFIGCNNRASSLNFTSLSFNRKHILKIFILVQTVKRCSKRLCRGRKILKYIKFVSVKMFQAYLETLMGCFVVTFIKIIV